MITRSGHRLVWFAPQTFFATILMLSIRVSCKQVKAQSHSRTKYAKDMFVALLCLVTHDDGHADGQDTR